MDSASQNIWKIISGILFCVIVANLVYLNVLAFQTKQTQSIQVSVTPTLGPSQVLFLTGTPTPTFMPSTAPTVVVVPTKPAAAVVNPTVKEYFIPFGTGTSSAADWQDVPGLQAVIDSTNYPSIKSVLFEISLRNTAASQEVHARLYNTTDNHPLWTSEVIYSGGNTGQLLVSSPISLDAGSKTYKIQLKTQLEAPTVIDQSRLHITLQ